MLNRRHFLKGSSLVAASALGFPHVARSAEQLQAKSGQKPRHIIHLVSDGMSMGTLTCADHLSHRLRERGLTWMSLYNNPLARAGLMNMRSLNSLVTDSSAASSSWGSGSRIMNGVVNQLPDGTDLKPLYELFAQAGWGRGLVTTTEITHATPAGFATNSESRDHAEKIAAQYLERKVDVLLGGGQKFFDPRERKDRRDLYGDFRKGGYEVMLTQPELAEAAVDSRWLGLFDKSHLPWTVDHIADPKKQAAIPTLATMTAAALRWLERKPHFILQVEGGRVDHACHNCDAAGALRDQIAFDEALDVCLEFQKRVPDTLLVITTDHGNANLGLNGMGTAYGQSSWLFANVARINRSFAEMIKLMKKTKTEGDEKLAGEGGASRRESVVVRPANEIAEIIRESTGYDVSLRRTEMFAPFLSKKGEALYDMMESDVAQLGQLLANYLGIGWTGTAHTADYVPILALGPGAERFQGFIQNTDVFHHYLAMAGIDFRNPEEPIIAGGPDAWEVENVREYRRA